jgi:hypothetical protein
MSERTASTAPFEADPGPADTVLPANYCLHLPGAAEMVANVKLGPVKTNRG